MHESQSIVPLLLSHSASLDKCGGIFGRIQQSKNSREFGGAIVTPITLLDSWTVIWNSLATLVLLYALPCISPGLSPCHSQPLKEEAIMRDVSRHRDNNSVSQSP